MLRSSLCRCYEPLFAVICFCIGLTFADPAVAQVPLYQVTNLGTLPGGSFSQAYGINTSGQIVGSSDTGQTDSGGNPIQHAFLWTPLAPDGTSGNMIDLGTLPGVTNSYAEAINAFGQVVGYSDNGLGTNSAHAFLWTPSSPNGASGSMIDLGTLPGGNSSYALGINAFGQVCGWSQTSGGNHGFLWTPSSPNGTSGSIIDLGVLVPDNTESVANGINDSGQVVGTSLTYDGFEDYAFLWTPSSPNGASGSKTNLGILPGTDISDAYRITVSGQVVGLVNEQPTNTEHMFFWTPSSPNGTSGTMQDVGFIGQFGSRISGINASGQVVGVVDIGGYDGYAFLWEDGKLLDLNSLIPANSSVTLKSALGINDSGHIVGYGSNGSNNFAFLLTPAGHLLPDQGGNDGDVSVTFVYPGLQSGATIALTAGATTISGDANLTSVVNDPNFPVQVLRSTFHLNGATPGAYNVVVNSPGMPTVTLNNAFTIQKSGAPQITISIAGRSQARAGYPATYDVVVANQGNLDAIDVPVWIAGLPSGTTLNINSQLPPALAGINISGISVWDTTPNQLMVPLIIPLMPAGATLSLPLQPTFPSGLIGTNTNLAAWTTPLYSLLAQGNSSNPTLLSSFQQLLGQIYQQAAGSPATSNSLSNATQTLLAQLNAISNTAYQNQSTPQFPTSFTQLLAQGVKLIAQNTGVTLADSTIQSAIDSALSSSSPPAFLQPQVQQASPVAITGPVDPNSVIGPLGWLAGSRPVQLSIDCANQANASNSARDVRIVAHLNAAVFDPNTLSLGDIQVVDQSLAPTPQIVPVVNQQPFFASLSALQAEANAYLILNPDQNLSANQNNASLAPVTNPLTWEFSSTNPDTNVGFLPQGQGIHVTFTVMPKAGLATGTSTGTMWAEIYFDNVAYVDPATGLSYKTWTAEPIDYDVPQSGVTQFNPPLSTNPTFTVYWHWTKPAGGSGLKDITVYRSDNNSGFVPWQITANPSVLTGWSSASYTGAVGHTYSFYSIARDNAGNVHQVPHTYATINIVQGPLVLTLPKTLKGGLSGSGKVTLNQAAPSGGLMVSLSSNNPAVTVPSSITVSGNSSSAPFSITTSPVGVNTSVKVSATANGAGTSALLTLLSQPLKALTLSPNPVTGGQPVTGTVQLSGVASVDTTVTLTNKNAAATVPTKVVVSAGTSSQSFTINTSAVTVTTVGKVTAKSGNLSKFVTLTVTP